MGTALSAELSAIRDEFRGELIGIREFAEPPESGTRSSLSPKARVAAANGATLLLAALYEECIRQMVKATFNFRKDTPEGRRRFPDKFPSVIWQRALGLLAKRQFGDLVRDAATTDLQVKEIISFCIKGDLTAEVSTAVAHNDNNMRPEEMGRLFNQIGVTNVIGKLGESTAMKSFFGIDNPGKVAESTRSAIEDFFHRRNEIAHAIQIGASGGPTSLSKDVELFEAIAAGLTDVLEAEA